METTTGYEHIGLDASGTPFLEGTTTKVVEVVAERLAYGWSAEEIHFQHPHLSLGQIHSALAYYWDHKGDLDCDVSRRLARTEELREGVSRSPLQSSLRRHEPA